MCSRPRERQPEDRHLTPRVAVILGPIKRDTGCRAREMEVSICTIGQRRLLFCSRDPRIQLLAQPPHGASSGASRLSEGPVSWRPCWTPAPALALSPSSPSQREAPWLTPNPSLPSFPHLPHHFFSKLFESNLFSPPYCCQPL